MFRHYFLWLLIPFLFNLSVYAQPLKSDGVYVDSLKQGLSRAQTPRDKVRFLMELALSSFLDPAQAESYTNQAVEVAELSRDRVLIAGTYLAKGRRYMNNPGLSNNLEQAINNFHRAEEIARTNNLTLLLVNSYSALSGAWRFKGDYQKALSFSNQALSIAGNTENDTARVEGYISIGETYLAMDEKLLSFRNFLEALTIAEKSEKTALLKNVYDNLGEFYASIHEYGKAIDYRMKEYDLDRKAWDVLNMLVDDYRMGDFFAQNKQQELAMKMYENAIELADTLHYDLWKWDPYFRIFNMYFTSNQYVKALSYLEVYPQVLTLLQKAGYQYFVDEIYGMSYTEQGRFDSAGYYFRRAEPDMEKKANPEGHYNFYTSFGDYHVRKKDYPQALVYYTKAYKVGEAVNNLKWQQSSALLLDSIYGSLGDYKSARFYNIRYHLLKDSLKDLSRDADMLKLEVENDNQRRERLARDEEARMEHRHNVQYMGFTVGLVVLFIVLVMLGWFAVPAGMIRALGFLSFIFLFEFIILLADKSIARWTHEEPWKVLVIKIGLAAILVPLHHWLEHKVIHYLSHRKRMTREGRARVAAEV